MIQLQIKIWDKKKQIFNLFPSSVTMWGCMELFHGSSDVKQSAKTNIVV